MNYSGQDAIILTFSDLKRVFESHRSLLKRVAIACGLLMFFWMMIQEPRFRAEATFQKCSKDPEVFSLKEIFKGNLGSQDNAMMALMLSNDVLRAVIEELGMQINVNDAHFFSSLFKKFLDNCSLIFTKNVEDLNRFVFSKVHYEDERPSEFFIKPLSTSHFQLFSNQKKVIGEGTIGSVVCFEKGDFVLSKMPTNVVINRFYPVSVMPWQQIVKGVKRDLKVHVNKLENSILDLQYTARDRYLAAAFLNLNMHFTQEAEKQMNEDVCRKQIAYLQHRKEEMTQSLDQALAEHVAYLKNALKDDGYLGLVQELETLSQPKTLYTNGLFDVDLQIKRLQTHESRDKKKKVKEKTQKVMPSPTEILNRKYASNLEGCDFEASREATNFREPLSSELEKISQESQEAILLLETLEHNKEIPQNLSILSDPKSVINLWVKKLENSEGVEFYKSQLTSYLRNFLFHHDQTRKTLEEDLRFKSKGMHEFRGLTLQNAQELSINYMKDRDALQGQIRQLIYVRDQLYNTTFDLSSIGAIFSDAVTHEMIQKASVLILQLKDDQNCSLREQQRLKEALETQKKFLAQHFTQTIELTKLRCKLVEDKILSLHHIIEELLQTEKGLLQEKLKELSNKMGDIPEKWQRETLLQFQKELSIRGVEMLTEIFETKNIARNFYEAKAKPLDFAFYPQSPLPKKFFPYSFLSALMGVFFCYLYLLAKTLSKGIPLSYENLKISGFSPLGKLSMNCNSSLVELSDVDLETIRCVAESISSQKSTSVALIGGGYANFSKALSELLAMQGKKVILINCVFDAVLHPGEMPGLWQFLTKEVETLPVRHSDSYDYLPSGGTSRHATELLQQHKFKALVEVLKGTYDVVLVYSKSPVGQSTARVLAGCTDKVIVSAQEETRESLGFYREKASFVYVEGKA